MGETRAHGTFFNPNFFAAYEAAVLLLSLGLLLFHEMGTLPPFYKRWLWVYGGCLVDGVRDGTVSRSIVALLGALSFLAFCRYGKKAFVILAVCLLAGLLVPNPLQHRIAHVAEDPYAYTRLDIWKSLLMRLLEHPLGIGVGMYKQGSFQDRFPIEGDIVRYRKRPESAHNEYLQIGVELGVVGLALLFCGAGLWTAEVSQLLRKPVEEFDRGLSMGVTASALVLLLHAAVDSSFHEPALVILLLLMGGLIHNLYIRSRPESVIWRRIGFSYHPLRAASVLGGAAIIAAICAQSAVAWYAHDEGKHHAAQDDLEGGVGLVRLCGGHRSGDDRISRFDRENRHAVVQRVRKIGVAGHSGGRRSRGEKAEPSGRPVCLSVGYDLSSDGRPNSAPARSVPSCCRKPPRRSPKPSSWIRIPRSTISNLLRFVLLKAA